MKTVKQAFDAGAEYFASHVLRYGNITFDDSYIDHTNKECRRYVVMLDGCECTIVKRTGEVIEASYHKPGSI